LKTKSLKLRGSRQKITNKCRKYASRTVLKKLLRYASSRLSKIGLQTKILLTPMIWESCTEERYKSLKRNKIREWTSTKRPGKTLSTFRTSGSAWVSSPPSPKGTWQRSPTQHLWYQSFRALSCNELWSRTLSHLRQNLKSESIIFKHLPSKTRPRINAKTWAYWLTWGETVLKRKKTTTTVTPQLRILDVKLPTILST